MDENKLMQMLAGSKVIMDKVESGNFTTGNIDQSKMLEIDPDQLLPMSESQVINEYEERPYIPQAKQPSYRNINTTKMPKAIVDAMVNNPINIPDSPYGSFEINEEMIKKINPEARTKRTLNPPQRLAEVNRMKAMSTGLSEDEVRSIVRDEMESIIFEYFDKRVIKEDIQIKVGSTIFSGSLSPLPKKKPVVTKR